MSFRSAGGGGGGAVTFAGPSGNIDIADVNAEGTSTDAARSDHQHAFAAPAAAPPDVAAAADAGVATTAARSNHTHGHTAAMHRAGGHADLTGDFAALAHPHAHSALTGLGNDDHAQYHTDARGDARYPRLSEVTSKGDMLAATGAGALARLGAGADGQVLTADSAQAAGLGWSTPSTGSGGIPQTLVDAKGDVLAASANDTVGRLAVGVDGQVLTADSAQPLGLRWGAAPVSALNKATALVTVVNTTAQTNLWSFAIPAGSIAAGDMIRLRAFGDYLNNTGSAQQLYPYFIIGGTTVLSNGTGDINPAAQSFRRPWSLDALIVFTGTAAESVHARFALGSSTPWRTVLTQLEGFGTATEDTATAKTVALAVAHATASASLDIRLQGALAEKVR